MAVNEFNLNDEVRVRLTDAGRKHYYAYVKREAAAHKTLPRKDPVETTAGYWEFVLWDFINIFGDGSPHFNGGPLLFDRNSLYIRNVD